MNPQPPQMPQQPQMSPRPQMPQQNKSNTAVMITVIICATVIVLFILGFILVKTFSNKGDNESANTAAENVAVQDSTSSSQPRITSLDVPEGDVKPAKKRTGSLSNVGFTDDYSDIVCYTYLSDSDLRGLSKSQLRILRNTIYARHGRKFKSKDLQNYFNGFSWYNPLYDEISPNSLSDIETHNIQLIQSYE